MSFFTRLFGRSTPSEEEKQAGESAETPPAAGKVDAKRPAQPPAKKAKGNGSNVISDERAKEIEQRARPDTKPVVPPPGTPSGNAAVPSSNKPTAGLFKKKQKTPKASAKKIEAIPRSPSVAPTQPPRKVEAKTTPTPTKKTDSDGGVLEELLGNLDESFDAIIAEQPSGTAPSGAAPNTDDFDRLSVLELFYDIATNHLRPVRNFMIELHLGDVRKEWINIAQPAVKSIQSAAEQMDIKDLKGALDDFDAMLGIAAESGKDMISGEIREEFINQYKRLAEIMPQAFTLEEERDQRESLIIHSLLMQVPDVRKVTIDRLYRAGLTALEVLFLATTEDLAATTGIRAILAKRIVDKFQGYRKESLGSVPDAEQSAQTHKLEELVKLLRSQQTAYEKAAAARDLETKRAHRLGRQGTLLEVTVVLAQLGEVELVEQLERLPFERRIERLEAFMEAQREKSLRGGVRS